MDMLDMRPTNLNDRFNNKTYIMNSTLKSCLETEAMGFEFESISGRAHAVKSTIANKELFLKIIEDKKLNVKQLDNYYFLIEDCTYTLIEALEKCGIKAFLPWQNPQIQFNEKKLFMGVNQYFN